MPFLKHSDIQDCFSIIDNTRPKTYCEWTWKIQKAFLWKNSSSAFNCWEVLWKKVVLKIFKFNNQQLVSRQNILRNTWGDSFLVRFSYLVGGFQRLCLNFNNFFQNSYQRPTPFWFFLFSIIMIHCKHYFEILFYVTFVFIKEKKI